MKTHRKPKKKMYTALGARPSTVPRGAPSKVRPRRALSRKIARLRLDAAALRWRCNPRVFDFRTTRELTPLQGMLGQRQALRSLRLGLSIPSPGYNLFLCGLSGVETLDLMEKYVRAFTPPGPPVPDRCYVQNFSDPQRPKLLELPRGKGLVLEKDVGALLDKLHRSLGKLPEKKWAGAGRSIIAKVFPEVLEKFPEPSVREWLGQWKRNLLQSVHHALVEDFEVNYLGRPEGGKVPVVVEKIPQPTNLFGWIGRRPLGDQAPAPHFTEIRAGSFLRADGGVLILNAADFYASPNSWTLLKSCLKYGTLQIEDSDAPGGTRTCGLKPDPIRVNVKVVVLGDYDLYDELFDADLDFREIFKVRVDFDSEVSLTPRVLRKEYPALIARTCRENGLRPLSVQGVARATEFAVRRAGKKNKISTETWVIADLLREADYWAGKSRHRVITAPDVQRAVVESILRLNLVETKISEMISDGTILIATSGWRLGQVNGLAIYDMGDYLFGKPSRITAETAYGQGGIINIERESGFSGRSHDKGVQILAGFLRSRFAQRRPLNLTASVCFEQSYAGIDGDSASATEIYAILSSLSGLPVRQDVAVTGSMNQKGDIQPIGAVNEKIEGFFDCVRAGHPTGKEGVIVPRKNVNDLMLRDDVLQAVRRGKFHIYAIDTVEQGLEILTGIQAGRRRKNNTYTPGSVFQMADQRLEDIANGLKQYQAPED
jgi:predicted ATP-dependent protease